MVFLQTFWIFVDIFIPWSWFCHMQAFSVWIPLAENSKSKILIKFDLFLYDNGMLYSTFLIKLDETKRAALEVNEKADLVI